MLAGILVWVLTNCSCHQDMRTSLFLERPDVGSVVDVTGTRGMFSIVSEDVGVRTKQLGVHRWMDMYDIRTLYV